MLKETLDKLTDKAGYNTLDKVYELYRSEVKFFKI